MKFASVKSASGARVTSGHPAQPPIASPGFCVIPTTGSPPKNGTDTTPPQSGAPLRASLKRRS